MAYTVQVGGRTFHGLRGNLHMHTAFSDGTKTHSQWDAYLHADLVTYPSLVEGFGNSLLETIYFCLPAIVSQYPVHAADIAPPGFDFVEIDGEITDARSPAYLDCSGTPNGGQPCSSTTSER